MAVIGVGHLGRYHAKTYANLANVQLVGLLDSDRARSKDRARELGVPAIADLNELLKNVDAVSVAVPTSDHHRIVK
ncbi:Gfo/Idh/MocA family oxidoreductase, partial [bacterium]|nr:Gfo/Idh/MocA family oxidoreductase [bacterium]